MITLQKATEITSEKVEGLAEGFKSRVGRWVNLCRLDGLKPYIYEGFRSNVRQAELYAQGRTTPGEIITKAQPGQSFHNYGYAFDWVPLIPTAKASNMWEAGWDEEKLYERGRELAKDLHLRWFDWDTPHLEDSMFRDVNDLKDALEKGAWPYAGRLQ